MMAKPLFFCRELVLFALTSAPNVSYLYHSRVKIEHYLLLPAEFCHSSGKQEIVVCSIIFKAGIEQMSCQYTAYFSWLNTIGLLQLVIRL